MIHTHTRHLTVYIYIYTFRGIWLLAIVKETASVAGLEDFDGRVRGFLQDVQVAAVEPWDVGGKNPENAGTR